MERYELPEGWEWTTLGDVCSVERGVTFSASDKQSGSFLGSVACLRTTNVQTAVEWDDLIFIPRDLVKNPRKFLRQNDILISMANSLELVGKVSFVDELPRESTFGGFISAIRAYGVVLPLFLFYYLRAKVTQEHVRSTASRSVNIANLSLSSLYETPIPLPPLAEQRRIVARLDALLAQARDSRAALDRIPPLLKRARQAILAAAFRGDLTERDPADAPADALLARLRVERRARWEDDLRARGKDPATHAYPEPAAPATADLPELPQGWAWTTLKGLTGFLTSGSRGWAKHYASDGPVFLRVGDLRYDSIDLDLGQVVHVDPPESAERARTQVQTEDILITITGNTIGKVAVVPASLGEGYVNQHIALVRPLPDYDVQFVAWYLSSQEGGQKQIADTQYGMTKPGLSLTDVENLNVPFAPAREQRQIVARVKALLGQAEAIEAAVRLSRRRLDLAEQALLARAFRGELVPQDPTDEPAAALLARLHDAREAASRGPNTKGKRRERKQKQPTADVAAAVQGRSGV